MGAMQAQDYLMAKWAVGKRLSDVTDLAIENALNKGEIIRTHIMRPTWHFVAAEDIYWMLELTSPQVVSSMKSRYKSLEFTESIISKSFRIIEKSLAIRTCLTRGELSKELNKAKINTNENRLSHLLMYAELNGIICNGPVTDKKQTYALLNSWVPNRKVFTREESLAELAKRYFRSHGPATISDFTWWSGLSLRDARKAIGYIRSGFISEIIGSKEYLFTESSANLKHKGKNVHLLPAYDEFLISYKDRNASVNLTEHKNVVSNNGIFRPVIVIDGQVSGLWRCVRKNENVLIEINFLKPQNETIIKQTEKVAKSYASYLGRPAKIIFNNGNKLM
jgi:hypothetical protein